MLHYPKIPGSRDAPDDRCIAFEKYDGTNLHWAWDRDFGWHGFGTRRDEFNLTDPGIDLFTQRHAHLKQCVSVFWATLADGLDRVFRNHPDYAEYQGFNADYRSPSKRLSVKISVGIRQFSCHFSDI